MGCTSRTLPPGVRSLDNTVSLVLELVIPSYRAKKFAAAACYAGFLISNFFNRICQLLDWHVVCHNLNSEARCAPRGNHPTRLWKCWATVPRLRVAKCPPRSQPLNVAPTQR